MDTRQKPISGASPWLIADGTAMSTSAKRVASRHKEARQDRELVRRADAPHHPAMEGYCGYCAFDEFDM